MMRIVRSIDVVVVFRVASLELLDAVTGAWGDGDNRVVIFSVVVLRYEGDVAVAVSSTSAIS